MAVELVIDEVARALEVPRRLILQGKKHRQVSAARAQIGWISRQLSPQPSYPEIAATLHCRGHSSVLGAVVRLERARETDPQLRAFTDALLERVSAARAAALLPAERVAS